MAQIQSDYTVAVNVAVHVCCFSPEAGAKSMVGGGDGGGDGGGPVIILLKLCPLTRRAGTYLLGVIERMFPFFLKSFF